MKQVLCPTRCFASLAVVLVICTPRISAQEFAREITQFVGGNARPFLQPIADALTSNLHAGMHSEVSSDGLHFSVSVVAMGVAIPDERKSFVPQPFNSTVEFSYNGVAFLGDLQIAPTSLPTAAGLGREHSFTGRLQRVRPKGSSYVPGVYDFIQQDATVTFGGYRDVSNVFFVTPQATLGSFFATDVTLRFLPAVRLEDIGEVSWYGVGITHRFTEHFSFPVDISGSVMYQSMTLKASDEGFALDADLKAISTQLRLSKTFSAGFIGIEPFTSVGYEKGSLDVRYEFADPIIGKQSVPLETKGSVRYVVGVAAKILAFRIHADVNSGDMIGYSMGIGLGF